MDKDPKTPTQSSHSMRLKLDVVPDRAAVFCNDKFIGHVSEFEKEGMRVISGRHRIKIELHGYETFETEITFIPGQKPEIRTRLARLSDKSKVATLSVLDRLIDREPKRKSEPMPTPAQSLRDLKAALRRDLEWLLNTRRIVDDLPESSKEVRRSVYLYGLEDTSSLKVLSTVDQSLLLKSIEDTVALFEPRLARVKVSMRPVLEASRLVHFVIEGLLRVDPEPVPIEFDTVLEITNGTYQIQGVAGA